MDSDAPAPEPEPVLARVARSYVRSFMLSLLGALAVLATFNIRADIYDVFGMLGGETRPIHAAGPRTSKAWALRARKPDCLILGTSRAGIGYRSSHPALSSSCSRPYNGGLPKAHVYEVRRYLQHALAQGHLKHVFLALDFEMFRNNNRTLEDFSEKRLATDAAGRWQPLPLNELVGLALSLDVTRDGIKALRAPPRLPWFDADGNWQPESMEEIMHDAGNSTGEASRKLTRLLVTLFSAPGTYDVRADGSLAAFDEFDAVIDLCQREGVQLTVVLNPVHAYYHELLTQLGLGERYEQWKQQVAQRMHARFPQQRYWHFDVANGYTKAAMPAEDDKVTQLAGFWDPSHFRRTVGDSVMQLALGPQDAPDSATLASLQQPASSFETETPWTWHDAGTEVRMRSWIEDARAASHSQAR